MEGRYSEAGGGGGGDLDKDSKGKSIYMEESDRGLHG